MTTLGYKSVWRGKKYSIYLSVSGDLSHSYSLIRNSSIHGRSTSLGYPFKTKGDAKRFIKIANKYGYGSDKFRKMHERHLSNVYFGYLSYKQSLPYLEDAYGDVAEKYKRRLERARKR